ncbi:MAG: histidine ammonia-lyase [Acidobacteriota bacterium]
MAASGQRIVHLDGSSLSLDDLEAVAVNGARVVLDPAARRKIQASRSLVERLSASEQAVYGLNTGFGHLASVRVPAQHLGELQKNLVRSHCVGVGACLPRAAVRATMLLRANALARGHSGIRPAAVEMLLTLLNEKIHPRIPSQGSVGASGDLAPLAHLARGLMGEGTVEKDGRDLPARLVLGEVGLPPLELKEKEGLALINGTQVTTAIGALALIRSERLVRCADVTGAMSLEGLKGSIRPFDPRVQAVRPHPGQASTAENLRRLTADSGIEASHRECGRVQDSYALRCMPQVHGAVRDTLAHARQVLTIEANSSTDNPLVFAPDQEMLSCGNFHAAPAGYVLDFLAIVMADLASISERRIERLVNPMLSGLPAFLTPDPGLHSGFMLVQVTAAALVSENKILAHPASVDSIPTSANKEDHVSMATLAARKATQVVDNTARVLALEALAAAQALDFLEPLEPGRGVAAAHAALRRQVARLSTDRPMAEEIEKVRDMLEDGRLCQAVEDGAGPLL